MSSRAIPRLSLLLALSALLLCSVTPAAADWQAGVAAYQAQDWTTAETAFRQVVAAQGDWYGGHMMLGRTLLALDRPAEALTALERSLEIERRPDVALVLARTALEIDRPATARAALADEPPAELSAAHRAAWLSLRARAAADDASRLRDLEAAVALTPDDADLRLLAGDAALDAGKPRLADTHLTAAATARSGDRAVVARLVKARLALMQAADDADRAAACGRAAEAAERLATLDASAEPRLIAGQAHQCAGNADAARTWLSQAVDTAGDDDPRAALALTRVQLDGQDWGDAERTLTPWIDRIRDLSTKHKAFVLLGRACEGQQRFEEAIAHYQAAGDHDGVRHAEEGLAARLHNDKIERDQEEVDRLQQQIQAAEAELRETESRRR